MIKDIFGGKKMKRLIVLSSLFQIIALVIICINMVKAERSHEAAQNHLALNIHKAECMALKKAGYDITQLSFDGKDCGPGVRMVLKSFAISD